MSLLMPLSSGVISALFAMLLASAIVEAQQPTTADQAPTRDTSYIDAQGTARVTRVVPVPKTISTEAQRRRPGNRRDRRRYLGRDLSAPPVYRAGRNRDQDIVGGRGDC